MLPLIRPRTHTESVRSCSIRIAGTTLAGLLTIALVGSLASCRVEGPGREPRHVVFVLIDTLRADHMGCYGYSRNTTPNLDVFADDAVLFERTNAQASWTLASLGSIFTSLYPPKHGLVHPSRRTPLPRDCATLAERLKDAGFTTAAFVANGIVIPETGLDQGFDVFEQIRGLYAGRDEADLVNGEVFDYLESEYSPEDSLFLYVHYMDPHDPYTDPDDAYLRWDTDYDGPFTGEGRRTVQDAFVKMRDGEDPRLSARDLEHLRARYDGEIRSVDARVVELFERLDALGIYDDAIIVVTSDHGEQFREHGSLKHATTVYQEEIAVPLIIRDPSQIPRGRRVADPVETIDIVPTILDALGLATSSLDGRSLLDAMRGVALPPRPRFAVTHHAWVRENGRFRRPSVPPGAAVPAQWAILDGDDKLLVREGGVELYDLALDPAEQSDLAKGGAVERIDELRGRLDEWRNSQEAARIPADPYTRSEIERVRTALEELGYVEKREDGASDSDTNDSDDGD